MSLAPVVRWFSIGETVRETGVPAATLRAWERRYGVPRPMRSQGRQRLYSHRDVEMVRWLLARQREGTSISRAIATWKQLEARGELPAQPAGASAAETGLSLDDLRAAWVNGCLGYDRRLAESTLARAFALYSQEDVCAQILQRGLAEIGEAWSRGEASVQQEHFASALATHWLERLTAATPPPWRGERLLLACAPGEQHTFGLQLLNLLLRQRGWDTLFLGANVPSEQLESTVAEARPAVAVLAAYRLPTAATLIEMARTLHRLEVVVSYGGPMFDAEPSLRRAVPGHFLGEDLWRAPAALERLIAGRPLSPPPD